MDGQRGQPQVNHYHLLQLQEYGIPMSVELDFFNDLKTTRNASNFAKGKAITFQDFQNIHDSSVYCDLLQQ